MPWWNLWSSDNDHNRLCLFARHDSNEQLFRRMKAVQRAPGEARLIPGVIGHTSNDVEHPGSVLPRKRPMEDDTAVAQRRKRPKRSDHNTLHRLSNETPHLDLASRKRQRSPSPDADFTSNKRLRERSVDNVDETGPSCAADIALGVIESKHSTLEPQPMVDSNDDDTPTTSHDEREPHNPTSGDADTPNEQNPTIKPQTTGLRPESIGSTDTPTIDGMDQVDTKATQYSPTFLEKRLAAIKLSLGRTARAHEGVTFESHAAKLLFPIDLVVGVGTWQDSNRIPGSAKLETAVPDVIPISKAKVRSSVEGSVPILKATEPRRQLRRVAVRNIQLPPPFVSGTSEARRSSPASKRRLKPKKQNGGDLSRVRLTGIWNRSVGSPMGPPQWTG